MLSTTLLLLVAALNLVPGVVALRPKRTVALYGIAIDGPALALAMRHRAVLLTLARATSEPSLSRTRRPSTWRCRRPARTTVASPTSA